MRQTTADEQLFIPLRIEEETAADVARRATSRSEVPGDGCRFATNTRGGELEIESADSRMRFGPVDAAALRMMLTHIGRRE